MQKYYLSIAAAFALVLATGSTAQAQTALFGFDDHSGSPNSGTYSPGDSFTFTITLSFTSGGAVGNVAGLSYWFEQQNVAAPFYFSITNRDASGSQFSFLQTPGLVYPQNMTPQNANDLGASTASGSGLLSGSYFIANLTIHIDPSAAPGIYQIENTTTGGKTSKAFSDTGAGVVIPQAIYTITVVPEPGTVALCVTGLTMVAGFLRRRRGN